MSSHDLGLSLILEARHHDPLSWLGLHHSNKKRIFRSFLPYAHRVWLGTSIGWQEMGRKHPDGLYTWAGDDLVIAPCKLRVEHHDHTVTEQYDAYTFPVSITDHDLYLFGEGNLLRAYEMLGAQIMNHGSVSGVRFAVWAPNADRVSVVGDFNRWDGRINPMQSRGSSGVWELFIPHITPGQLYKFEIRNRHTQQLLTKADPYGRSFEVRPNTAARVTPLCRYLWHDQSWLAHRHHGNWLHTPMNVYEMHMGSWQRDHYHTLPNYRDLAPKVIEYANKMSYTHIELMPICEHPLDESWGYQTTGYFAVTSRYGSPDDFRFFVDQLHQAGIGIILDWVPAHFPKDSWALAHFDGSALYEHEDPRLGEHQDWGTLIFNYGRNEVRNFLLSNAYYWLSEFHIDGLRVDAVASMLYLDYSRNEMEWVPNQYGGRENLEAMAFLRTLNTMVHQQFPGALTIAEESTAWPMVSRPVYLGGLGFSMKWNMGWMNDTLAYFKNNPIHRSYHHNQLTFGQIYAYTENFVLPFSHDEVVHGKNSLLDRMPGDPWQKFANLRLLLSYQMSYPGKKLNFMGNEFGQGREWNVNGVLDWHLLEVDWHRGIQNLMADLGRLYCEQGSLHELDFQESGFCWIDCHNAADSVLSYLRFSQDRAFVVVILNFTPVTRPDYRIGVPSAGRYVELINSDADVYGGANVRNSPRKSEPVPWMHQPHSVVLTIPALAAVILKLN